MQLGDRVVATEENRAQIEALLGFKLPKDLDKVENGVWVAHQGSWTRLDEEKVVTSLLKFNAKMILLGFVLGFLIGRRRR